MGRRHFLTGGAALLATPSKAAEQSARRWKVAFANLTEEAGVKLEGLGFVGADVRRSFELAARTLPVDMIYFDNGGDSARALARAPTRGAVGGGAARRVAASRHADQGAGPGSREKRYQT